MHLELLAFLTLHQLIIMLSIATRHYFRFTSKKAIPLALGYPFEYTLGSGDFAFADVRFTEIPLSRELWPPEKEHIHFVLNRFEKMLNGNREKTDFDKYIRGSLKSKVSELADISKESKF